MGIKKMFKKRDPTEQELVEDLKRVGITTKTTGGRQEKFGAFKQYAQERQTQRPGMAPVNPYVNMGNNGQNPYAASQGDQNPYSRSESMSHLARDTNDVSRPYGNSDTNQRQGNSHGNPYGSATRNEQSDTFPNRINPYEKGTTSSRSSQRTAASENTSYTRKPNPYARANAFSNGGRDDESTLDLNDIPSGQPPVRMQGAIKRSLIGDSDSLDLNELPDEDLNVEVDDFLPEQEQVNSEDEEVEAIKQDIRFTKQESLASTRNTLRMAQEADVSGVNTMGMLGSQSERLHNAEKNLLLADTQTKIADEKVKELQRLNRSIFIPATGNPFNKKSRLRQQEMKLKSDKEQEKYLRDTNRQAMYASEQRLTQGIKSSATSSETHNKYQGEKYLQQAQRYQFENDSEDDEMEKELASNLDQIANYSKKLKNTAMVMGQEVDAQNDRLRRIEEDADRLDINVHLNSSRLNNIR